MILSEFKDSTINNKGFYVLSIMSMFYVSSVTLSTIVTERYMEIFSVFFLGGSFISPVYFIFADMVAEIYGPKIAKNMVLFSFLIQITFACIATLIINSESPPIAKHSKAFYEVFNPVLKLSFESFFAYYFSGIINIKIISKLKIKLNGKKYWLRSFLSSTFSEALYSAIAIISMELFTLPSAYLTRAILASYMVKIIFSLCTMYPCQKLVDFLKSYTGIDVYDNDIFTAKNNLSNF